MVGLLGGLAGLSVCLLQACSVNPATGRTQFNLMGREEEIAMGTSESPKFAAEFGGKLASADLQSYVTRVGMALAAQTEADFPSMPWEFTLLNSDVINAFALPGGKIFITRGLVERMTSEAQLAGVLGHEVGHVTARHINERMADAGLSSLLIGVVSSAAGREYGANVQAVGEQIGGVVLLKFGRDQESEADKLGMRYMSRVNYNPRAQREVMEILQKAMASGRQPEIFSSHPFPETRIERIDKLLRTEFLGTQNNPAFVTREREFQAEFLAKLRAQPRPAPNAPRTMIINPQGFAGADHSSWCGVCAMRGG
jgi:predicted Zn-dependent protease